MKELDHRKIGYWLVCLTTLSLVSLLQACNHDDYANYSFRESLISAEDEETASGSIGDYEYVDLGLSVVWATLNVGATSVNDYGSYYAWGETTTKSEYTSSNSSTYEKNISDISGNSKYDVARATWGESWRMPTRAEMLELVEYCTWTASEYMYTSGYILTSNINGNSIYLPTAGVWYNSSVHNEGAEAWYWSSTPPTDSYYNGSSYCLKFNSSEIKVTFSSRYRGCPVRPVSD